MSILSPISMSLQESAEKIWRAALEAVAPQRLIENTARVRGGTLEIAAPPDAAGDPAVSGAGASIDLDRFAAVYLIALGKAAPGMAAAMAGILGRRLLAAVVVAPPGQGAPIPAPPGVRIRVIQAPHPHPDARSAEAAREILALAYSAGEDDILVVSLSGGGSAMAALPAAGIALADKARIARDLMLRGAGISELNTVRKHLSAIKGGRLAEAASPATILNLAISDVAGDDLGIIASGVSYWDTSTYADARRILESRALWEDAGTPIKSLIEKGRAGLIPETPKKGDPAFARASSFVIGNNGTAIEAARAAARALGFETEVAGAPDHGDARAAARAYARRLLDLAAARNGRGGERRPPFCLIWGGELTVDVKGTGRGGRNQEFALALLREIALSGRAAALAGRDWLIASLGTDGIDGHSDAAGACASPAVLARARELGLDIDAYLENNDSNAFFSRAGGLIVTGPTGTNVMDLRLILLA